MGAGQFCSSAPSDLLFPCSASVCQNASGLWSSSVVFRGRSTGISVNTPCFSDGYSLTVEFIRRRREERHGGGSYLRTCFHVRPLTRISPDRFPTLPTLRKFILFCPSCGAWAQHWGSCLPPHGRINLRNDTDPSLAARLRTPRVATQTPWERFKFSTSSRISFPALSPVRLPSPPLS